MRIRPEAPGDEEPISTVTEAAFMGAPHSDGTEVAIIIALRAANALSISLVATDADDAVVGHVAFSPITIQSVRKLGYLIPSV